MKSLEIMTLSLGALDTNCYIVENKKTSAAWVIDPADSGDVISEEIIRRNLNLEKIILTHGHFDHILGLLEVKLNFPQAEIWIHKDDLFLLETAKERAKHWLKRIIDPVPAPDKFFSDDDKLTLGNSSFKILHTPGHTPGSVVLYCEQENLLFSGDTIFADGAIGRTDFSYSDPKKMRTSLKKIHSLPSGTLVYSGHGAMSTIG